MPGVSGVGVSFGADRIYDVMQQLNNFPSEAESTTQIIFVNFGEKETTAILPLISDLRLEGIATEIYPDPAKFQKQFGYANANRIPYVALAGEEELSKGIITLKDMNAGTQEQLTFNEFLIRVKTNNR
jgi:histidyl-tRNA synthetase